MAIRQVIAYTDGQGRLFESEEGAREANRLAQAADRRERLRRLIAKEALPGLRRIFGSGSLYGRLDGITLQVVAEAVAHAIENKTELAREIARQLEEQG